MAGHEERFRRLRLAIEGQKVEPVSSGESGSLNYKSMDLGTAAIAKPSQATLSTFTAFLNDQLQVGHCSRRGPRGVACEPLAPGMHGTYNCAPVAGVLRDACRRGDGPESEHRRACVTWLANEAGLGREFRHRGEVWAPGPRVKDEKGQAPHDGYRDVWTAMLSGEKVQKRGAYWEEPQALAVKTLRELLTLKAAGSCKPLTEDELHLLHTAPMPRLYLPINKAGTDGGGYFAWIEDTEAARTAMGRDACNWVLVPESGTPTWGYDWAPHPGSEAA